MCGLAACRCAAHALFDAITERQCTRGDYDGTPLSASDLALLQQAAAGPGVRLVVVTSNSGMAPLLEAIVRANRTQVEDKAFVDELKRWIRFNPSAALDQRDGLFAGSAGNPSIPSWLGRLIFGLPFRPGSENEKITHQVRSSAGIAVFISDRDDKAHWVEAGRSYQRFALQATTLGVRNAFLGQPVEVTAQWPAFAAQLGLTAQRPDLIVRFGRGSTMPRSMRRPLEQVLVS